MNGKGRSRLQIALAAGVFWASASVLADDCSEPARVCFKAVAGGVALIDVGEPAPVWVDAEADSAVRRVAESFADDLGRVGGTRAVMRHGPEQPSPTVVVIGVAGESQLIDALVEAGKLKLNDIEGAWEAFHIEVLHQPWPNVGRALVIAGSDRRGAIFGTYELSREMGVSPWHWFADVPVSRKSDVYVSSGLRSGRPSVRYRGLFINDEDPALGTWARKQFGGVNAAMYEQVFELLLRLKGNYLWPAMWAPKSFHLDDRRNAALAHEMGVVMGTSHHEPLTRAQSEWHRIDEPYAGGAWDYRTNAANLRAYWRAALERMMAGGNEGFENLLTIGMRGDGDAPMAQETAVGLLEGIVADQRKLIEEVTGRPAAEVPQVWALYKEVQDYYDQGMRVPDDVTLLFADDNWGQIRRLPSRTQAREGGYGVYYHFDYVGVPRNYKWLNTNQIEKVWQQMDLAYARGARDVWVVNVGDIKPMEYPISFFMDMAWSPQAMTPEALRSYPDAWASQQFGDELGAEIGSLLTRYSKLAARRKPELVNENSYALGARRSDTLVRGEWSAVVGGWRGLVADLELVSSRVDAASRDAFFQLVEFPILAMSNLHEMYFATAWNRELAAAFDPRGNFFARAVDQAFARDERLTQQFHSMRGEKWDGMMSQVHMNYTIWNDPMRQSAPPVVWTAGDVPEKMRDAEPVFEEASDPRRERVLDASAFDRRFEAGGVRWTAIPHLGQGRAALVGLPQGQPSTERPAAPRVEYDIEIAESGDVTIGLRLLPTLDTTGSGALTIGVSLDQGPIRRLGIDLEPTGGAADTKSKQRWFDAVIENGVTVSTRFDSVRAGAHVVKVWRLDDNVVLESISVESREVH